MSAIRPGDAPPTVFGFLPVLAANLLPLCGVVWLGWDPATLVAVYVLELQLLFPIAGVKALFAGRPPAADRDSGVISVTSSDLVAKRGSVTLYDRLPPIYPRNVPFAAAVVGGGAWIGLFVGLALSGVVSFGAVLRRPEVLGSVVALVGSHLVETGTSYVRREGYVDVSPYAVVERPARQGFFLAFVLIAVPATGAAGTTLALAGFVLVKVLFEWSGFRAERGGGGRLTGWLSGPDSESVQEPLDVPDGEPSAVIDVDRRAVAASAVWRAVTSTGPFYASTATFVWLGTVVVFAGPEPSSALWTGGALVALVTFGLMFASDVVEDLLASGWVTYRRIGDRLVVSDRLTGAPQWSASVGVLRDATVVDTRFPDRYFGTRTITVNVGWGADDPERILGPVGDPDALIEAFELPVRSTELSPLDRRFAGAAVVSGGLLVVGGAALLVTPFGSPGDGLYLLFLLPLLVVVPKGFWKLAHP